MDDTKSTPEPATDSDPVERADTDNATDETAADPASGADTELL